MKLLLIGPYPPPHGGISVHVCEAKRQLDEAGVRCRVLNINRQAPQTDQYICVRSGMRFLLALFGHARRGWILHLHTNGHNQKSWLMAFVCGLAGQLGPACLLTLHSGMAPLYLRSAHGWRRYLCRATCLLYDHIIAVNPQIRGAVIAHGISPERVEELPAYLSAFVAASLPAPIEHLVRGAEPLLSTVLFYRPEYGFELLAHAVARLRSRYKNLRCLVMGSGEQREQAERIIREMHLDDVVLLLGDVPHELCLAIISASDLFVRATLEDGDSISVREALSLGVPAVVSDVGARPPGAILFETGNLADLVSKLDADLNHRLRDSSRSRSQPAANGAQRLIEIYQQVSVQGARI